MVITTVLKTKVEGVEFSKSTMQTRLMELVTESSPVITAEAPNPTVTTEAAPPTKMTGEKSKEPTIPTPTAAERNPAEGKSEVAKEKTALEDTETALVFIHEQNRKKLQRCETTEQQVPETFPKVGALLTNDDDAPTGRAFPIGPIPEDTKKKESDPESNNPCSSPKQRFMEPPDKLPMPNTACDKMVLCGQPFRTR
jgi:hypothetical protein